jgi:hypothetical protein
VIGDRTEDSRIEEDGMAFSAQVLDNPISGERITFRKTAADTDGELLAIDLELSSNGHVPGARRRNLDFRRSL